MPAPRLAMPRHANQRKQSKKNNLLQVVMNVRYHMQSLYPRYNCDVQPIFSLSIMEKMRDKSKREKKEEEKCLLSLLARKQL